MEIWNLYVWTFAARVNQKQLDLNFNKNRKTNNAAEQST